MSPAFSHGAVAKRGAWPGPSMAVREMRIDVSSILASMGIEMAQRKRAGLITPRSQDRNLVSIGGVEAHVLSAIRS